VLGVCTGDGRTDRMAGSGMTELLQIIDVQRDGRDEIFYGGTTATARYFDVAVFRRGKLRRVLRPKGRGLALVYTAHCNDRWYPRYEVYDSLVDARGKVPQLILAEAGAELGEDFAVKLDV
jgi:hypothetical protein